jgi:hypothetical protein
MAGIRGAASGIMAIQNVGNDPGSITTLLTQSTNASGNTIVKPIVSAVPEFYWSIGGGTNAGDYYINRNDPQGLSYWYQAMSGAIGFNQFYNYEHWTPNHGFDGTVNINSPWDMQIELLIEDYSAGPVSYFTNIFNGPAQPLNPSVSVGSYQHSYSNAGFLNTIRITNLGFAMGNVNQLDVVDLDTGDPIASFTGGTSLPPAAPTDFFHNIDYWRRMYISIDIG